MSKLDDAFVRIEAADFSMGSNDHYSEEAPVVMRSVSTFELCRWPVTNVEFATFVQDSAYITTAERTLNPADFPEVRDLDISPGSLVFTETAGPVDLRDWRRWWRWVPGASWRSPSGPGSSIDGMEQHPVVHISFSDALAYCDWAGTRLPDEAEWELAARGGRDRATYAWGDDLRPDGLLMANTWQGSFPYFNRGASGWKRTSPVGTFPSSDFGLVDMIGNVWEWTSTSWTSSHGANEACGCAANRESKDADMVIKGGSHLCAPEYCQRYRPAARTRQSIDSSTTHLGFRVARDLN